MKQGNLFAVGILLICLSCNNNEPDHGEGALVGGSGINSVVGAAVSVVVADTTSKVTEAKVNIAKPKDSAEDKKADINKRLYEKVVERPEEKAPVQGSFRWVISKQDDKRTMRTNYFANVNASEHLFLKNGVSSEAMLNVANRKGQNEVVLRLDKGSFDNSLGNKISINALFDDKDVKTLQGEISEYVPNCITFSSGNELIGYFKKYKKFQFELTIKDEGKYIIKFNTEKLLWEH